jgi:hypothetical protein
MNHILSRLLSRASELADVQPLVALFLGAALLAVFLAALLPKNVSAKDAPNPSLLWTLYHHFSRMAWAVLLVLLLATSINILRTYLRHTVNDFQRSHGRITQANYNAVETIWGAEQVQNELTVDIHHDEEVIERIAPENPNKPDIIHQKTVRKTATGNPFVSVTHEVTLKQNPRKKGSAYYDGYETTCSFDWKLRNPSDTNETCLLTFPLPAAGAMYDGLVATLDGKDVLPEVAIKDGSLLLDHPMQPGEDMTFHIGFKSRGLTYWYFQVRESREIRDFTLTLNLPDLPKAKLNYPDGCMTPTTVEPTKDGLGTVLTYRLDHALTDKGMGIALPQLPQPGAVTRAVLGEVDSAWLFVFAMLALNFTLGGVRHGALLTLMFATATAFGYGLLADFSDLLLGFWLTAAFVVLPFFLLLAYFLRRVAGQAGKWLALQFLLFGIAYPCLAGLDDTRETLYLNLCALAFLAFAAAQIMRQVITEKDPIGEPALVKT